MRLSLYEFHTGAETLGGHRVVYDVANDTAAQMVFAQQVYGLGKPGDVLLGITTSGNSANVINAVAVAKTFGLKTIILTGRSGGNVGPMADTAIRVPADEVADMPLLVRQQAVGQVEVGAGVGHSFTSAWQRRRQA